MSEQTALTTPEVGSIRPVNIGQAMKLAEALANSEIVPKAFRSAGAAYIALELAERLSMPVLMVMQNLYLVHGMPAWKGSFCRALIERAPGADGRRKYTSLRYEWKRDAADRPIACRLVAVDRSGVVVEGTWITMDMVKAEGWDKNPKWQSMREQMFQYRASSFFQRANCPEAGLGLLAVDEVEDVAIVQGVIDVPAETQAAEPAPATRTEQVKRDMTKRRAARTASDGDPLTAEHEVRDDGDLFAGKGA